MLVFWAAGAAVTYLLLNVDWFMETVGFLALFTEAMLGTPQFLRNFRNKSTAGMSMSMVVMWTLGDIFKTVYFVAREAPMQFWICGTLQFTFIERIPGREMCIEEISSLPPKQFHKIIVKTPLPVAINQILWLVALKHRFVPVKKAAVYLVKSNTTTITQ
ncbi:hypothetical protein HA402_004320 [Bradysia odoriphaga]|nr:hypothetical protein HA402_004320 [Bradysia odoriphaga]